MSKTKFVVGDRVKFVSNNNVFIATAIPSIGAVGVIKTACDILPWYSIEWDIKEEGKDYSPWFLEEMIEGV